MSLICLQRSLWIAVVLISTLFEINAQVCADESACNYEPFSGPGYCLQIEPFAVHSGMVGLEDLSGYTTYRIYALCESVDDFVSSVSGDSDFPTTVFSDGDVFQSSFGGALGSDINNSLLSFFPSLAFDSFVTIGLTEGATGTEGSINTVNSEENPWEFNFENTGNIAIDDEIGGGWFIFNGETNGIAGEDFRVLLGQITTNGALSGSMYVQFFEEGLTSNELRVFIDFESACLGVDDTTDCTYPENGFDCEGNCLLDSDGDGVCDPLEIGGCTDALACNYSEGATDEDGSCIYPDAGYDCLGICVNDADQDGICDEFEFQGCSDSNACNYDLDVTEDDGTCVFPDDGYDCNGDCINDQDGDGICDAFEMEGCTDSEAANFNPFATNDNGSCVEPTCIDEDACNFSEFNSDGYCLIIEPFQEHDGFVGENDLTGHVTYRIYARCENPTDFISSVSGDMDFPTRIMSTEPMFQSPIGGLVGSDQNASLFGFFPSAQFDSYVTIGLTGAPAEGEGVINATDSPNNPWGLNFEFGNDLLIDDEIGGGWYILNGQTNGVAGDDLRVLLAQVTTSGVLSGSLYLQVFVEGSSANEVRELIDLNAACIAPGGADDCNFPEFGVDCDGNCLVDSDGDGVCDPFEISGCQDNTACNFNSEATDDSGACIYASTGYDCQGTCLVDSDGDGVCDPFEVDGCTDSEACNYNGLATEEDASCTYPSEGYDCTQNCINDADEDGVCDEFEVAGCMDSIACNYDVAATDDDASCEFAAFGYDCDGNCLGDLDFDGICDANEIAGCTDIEASNFDPFATDDNGTCEDPICIDDEACNYTEFDYSGQCLIIEPVHVHSGFVGEDNLEGYVTYRIYARCENPTDFVSSVSGDADFPTRIQSTEPFYQSSVGGLLGDNQNPALFGFFPSAEFDSFVTIGLTENAGEGEGSINYVESDENSWGLNFEGGSDLLIDDEVGGAWFIFSGQSNGFAGDDHRVLLAQVTTAGALSGSMYVQYFINGSVIDEVREFIDLDGACISPGGIEACEFPELGYDCDGNCLADDDMDGVCDEFEIEGCTDTIACNYAFDATDENGTCLYADFAYDCEGNCISDLDGDGICDELEIAGCQDAEAANYDPIATDDDGSCIEPVCIDEDACNYTDFDWSGYCLTIEPYQIHSGFVGDDNLEGQVTYRIYARCENPSDFVSSVSGDIEFPTRIQSTQPFFQSPFGGLLSMDQQPSIFGFFPSAEFDSFLTIGLTESAGADEGNINITANTGNPWGANFENGEDLLIDDAVGGGWFIFNGQTNGIAGDDHKVLLAQVTTAGALSGSMYVQFFKNGSPADEVRQLVNLENACITPSGPEACEYPEFGYDCAGDCLADADGDGVCDEFEVAGCQDDMACNYDADATDEDGSCTYAEAGYDCEGNCLADADGDGICDEFEVAGCQDDVACNYDADATDEDGSCFYQEPGYDCNGVCLADADGDGVCDEFEVAGCQDDLACNYVADATDEDGSCAYADAGYDCAGNCLADADGDGVCDEFEVAGCQDNMACNYDANATDEDGSCAYADAGYDCAGNCLADADGDGVCDAFEVAGCQDESACNYDADATDEDGSCTYADAGYDCAGNCLTDSDGDGVCDEFEITGCTVSNACNYNGSATDEDGSCDYCSCSFAGMPANNYYMTVEAHATDVIPGMTTYRFYMNMFNDDDFMSAVFGNNTDPMTLSTSTGFYNSEFGGVTAEAINLEFLAFFPELSADSWVTIGIDSQASGDQTAISLVESIDQPWVDSFSAGSELDGQDILINDFSGGAWYVLNGTPNGLPDPVNNRVLFMQLTTAGSISGTLNTQIFIEGEGLNDIRSAFTFNGTGDFYANGTVTYNACGCMDAEAFNYDPSADYDDGNCIDVSEGCIDATACNFNSEANTEDGSCTYADAGYDCAGNCLADADGDGVCDGFEVAGCQDAVACNYNADATDEDGSCTYADAGYDCAGNCLADADGDGVCDEFEVAGCQDDMACNYDADATDEDGSCTYADAGYDCAGNCLADADGDGVCDAFEVAGCQDDMACNYDADATDEDGSCTYADAGYDCNGVCLADADGDGVCDAFEVAGCQDDSACNYDVDATDEDGSCTYADAGYDCNGVCLADADGDGVCDAFEVAGCQDDVACNYEADATDEDGSCTYADAGYDCAGNCLADADGDSVCDEFEVAGCQDDMACNYDTDATDEDGSCTYADAGYDCAGNCLADADGDGVCDEFEVAGCQDDMACNYDSDATDEDGSCTYADAGYDCAGNCLADADGDGVCDAFEVAGCQDDMACNYDADATDEDGSCTYEESGYDCDGNCLADADGDSVCDEFEIVGCMVEYACNYDPEATDGENNDCYYATAVFDCEGNCQIDENENGICDQLEDGTCIEDCSGACGEGTYWDADLGQCIAIVDDCPYDLNGDGHVQLQDLLDFLIYYGSYCETE